MRVVRVKICGITHKEDLVNAVNAGADAVGFIVEVPSSPRNLNLEKAEKLMKYVPIFVDCVAVTVPANIQILMEICERLKPSYVQIHGDRRLDFSLIRSSHPETGLIRALHVDSSKDVDDAVESSKFFDAILTDSLVEGKFGGTGITHNWKLSKRIKQAIYPKPLILSGGLNPGNIRNAIDVVQPHAVDVCSGVEQRQGIKDPSKILDFVKNAKEVYIHE